MSDATAKKEERRKFHAIKGTRDLLPPDTELWNRVEQTAHEVFSTFGFGEIGLPIFEPTDLFARAVGGETDIVSKEMFSFPLRPTTEELADELFDMDAEFSPAGNFVSPEDERQFQERKRTESISLRPEATASVCRAYIEHNMQQQPQPVKLYYMGPMFRRERPQKGRYRQFYQIGAEILGGSDAPAIDAELIEILMTFFDKLELQGLQLEVNSIGCRECRPRYVELLRAELLKVKDKLGPDSQRRIETNPLRVLDSKLESEQPIIATLPHIADHLCEDCAKHYAAVKQHLELRGVIYRENWRLVRGLDYYMRTTFEIAAQGLGSQNAVCGGGRYDGLVEELGGPATPGVGFGLGLERFLMVVEKLAGDHAPPRRGIQAIALGEAARERLLAIAGALRERTAEPTFADWQNRKLTAHFKLADRNSARWAVILGDEELAKDEVVLRDLLARTDRRLPLVADAAEVARVIVEATG